MPEVDKSRHQLTTTAEHGILSARHGHKIKALSAAQTGSGTAPPTELFTDIENLGDEGAIFTQGNLALKFTAVAGGATANNDTVDVQVYLGDIYGEPGQSPVAVFTLLGTATFTFASGLTGVAGGYIGSAEFFADTVSWSGSAYATYIENETGKTIRTYSPADDANVAEVTIPDFGGRKLLVFVCDIPTSSNAEDINVPYAFRT